MQRYTREGDVSYALGYSITFELIKMRSHEVIEVLYTSKIKKNELFFSLKEECERRNIVLKCDDRAIERLSIKENCYVIGVFKKYFSALRRDKDHVIIEDIDEAGELGTIIRTCISFDMKDIVFLGEHIDLFEPKVVRSSMGSIFHANIETYKDLKHYISAYDEHRLYELKNNGDDIHDFKKEGLTSLIFSSKDHEVRPIMIKNGKELKMPLKLGITLSSLYAKD